MSQAIISWRITAGPRDRLIFGESGSDTDEEVRGDMVQLWDKLLSEVCRWYPQESWNSLECAICSYNGAVHFSLLRDFSRLKQLSGVSLRIWGIANRLRALAVPDNEFEQACASEDSRLVTILVDVMPGRVAKHVASSKSPTRKVPFRIFNSDDDGAKPLYESILEI